MWRGLEVSFCQESGVLNVSHELIALSIQVCCEESLSELLPFCLFSG